MSSIAATALLMLVLGGLVTFPFEATTTSYDPRCLGLRLVIITATGIWIAAANQFLHAWLWLIGVGVIAAILGPAVRWLRQNVAPPQWGGELEVAIIAAIVGAAVAFGQMDGSSASLPVTAPLTRNLIAVAAAIVVAQSGTPFVRGVLNKAGTLGNVGSSQLNAGRVIGVFERLLVFASVLLGQLELAGFLVAAKGFIRGRELESKDFSEYFILGTLASVSFAGGIGYLVRALLS